MGGNKPLGHQEIYRAVERLTSESRLVAKTPDGLEAGALVRAYYSDRFLTHYEAAFRRYHGYFFELTRQRFAEEAPRTIGDLDVYHRAIVHGCKADRYREALTVFWEKVCQGRQFHSQKVLGAANSDLEIIRQFFPYGFTQKPVPGRLAETDQAFLIAIAAHLLAMHGELETSVQMREVEIPMFIKGGDLWLAASDLRNLGDTLMFLGRLREALKKMDKARQLLENDARTASRYGRDIDPQKYRGSCIAHRARVLHLLGQYEESSAAFGEAATMFEKGLVGDENVLRCASLLELAASPDEMEVIHEQIMGVRQLSLEKRWIGTLGNESVLLGCYMWSKGIYDEADKSFDESVRLLTDGKWLNRLINAKIDRALFQISRARALNDETILRAAKRDLQDVDYYIKKSHIRLYQVDYLRANALCRRTEISCFHGPGDRSDACKSESEAGMIAEGMELGDRAFRWSIRRLSEES